MLKLRIKKVEKLNYVEIQGHSCKEVVTVIKKLISSENLKPEQYVIMNDKRALDVVLLGRKRMFIVRHIHGTRQAHLHEFQRTKWEQFTDEDAPSVHEFLDQYSEYVQPMVGVWARG
ncbi:hypothetical protein KM868_11890 [Micrococcus luteus]|uniref:hypothetical protein n=1 Tax=Micrococcus luteus TaxID=1270 RepID=UPI001C221C59|nr:hypothetical protein [Micrococcus luteus]MBU8764193.1 hypothetical protein [Micrococcus luteus]